jgi:hypothetical protein
MRATSDDPALTGDEPENHRNVQPQPPLADASVSFPEFVGRDERGKAFHQRLSPTYALVEKRPRHTVFIADEEVEQPLEINPR